MNRPNAAKGGERGERLSVLIVDDEPLMNRALIRVLRDAHETVSCVCAKDALAVLRSTPERFDAILIDVEMPAMSGIDLFNLLKNDPALVMRIGFMTSAGASHGIEEALGCSGRPLLEKPFTGAQARAFVRNLAR